MPRFGPYFGCCPNNLGMDEEEFEMVGNLIEQLEKTMMDIERHMKFCGDCINLMIDCGDLIPIEEWWAQNRKTKE